MFILNKFMHIIKINTNHYLHSFHSLSYFYNIKYKKIHLKTNFFIIFENFHLYLTFPPN